MTEYLKRGMRYINVFIKWTFLSLLVGIVCGLVGVSFHFAVDCAAELFTEHTYILYFLPLGGVLIALLYRLFSSKGKMDTNRVIESVRKDEKLPLVMVPLIFISTTISHFLGASVGREGAALQLGGGIGYNVGKLFRMNKTDTHIITVTGMSAVFSALFGTPVTAAVFSLEVCRVGRFNYMGFLPCIISAVTAYEVSGFFKISPMRFLDIAVPEMSATALLKVVGITLLCAMLSIFFLCALKYGHKWMKKLIKNVYVRAFAGGVAVVLLTLAIGTRDYNGAGMSVIEKALSGKAVGYAFLLKILFTTICISAGFKGGEIVPTLFIGSTFGCFMGGLLHLNPAFSAAVGLIALFCGVVNCPLASLFLSIEMFGADGILFFGIVCAISYMMSGYSGLYKSQEFLYSKLNAERI
ncbi:MAG: chloride channel protein [Clostridia bacterium]|nr:chloride channel protein [Clostridia bacterium]